MNTTYLPDLDLAAVMMLLGRIVFGLMFAAHGTQKLFGWFRGPGLEGMGGMLERAGFHPGRRFAALAGSAELVGGVLIALGLFGPIGPALLLSVVTVAILTVHVGNGLLSTSNGPELPILYATAAIIGGLLGPGPYSLDALFAMPAPWPEDVCVVILALGVLGGAVNAAMRHRVPAPRHA